TRYAPAHRRGPPSLPTRRSSDLAGDLERHRDVAAGELEPMVLAVTVDLDVHPFGERVHAGRADAVQASRHLVGVLVEFAAGMQRSEGTRLNSSHVKISYAVFCLK